MTIILTNVCLLLETLSAVVCLHHLYGKKFKLDITTIGMLAIDMIMMQTIDYFELPSGWSALIYLVYVIYCMVEFEFNLRALLLNNVLYILIVPTLQFIVMLAYCYMFGITVITIKESLVMHFIIFVIVMLVLPRCHLSKLSSYLQSKERLIAIALGMCIVVISVCLIYYKENSAFNVTQFFILFSCMILIGMLALQLGKSRIQSKEIETELKMHKLYEDSFHGLIENIRLRQHEFDNHINTIYGQHYTYNTYEDLVSAQRNYCQIVVKENRFYKLLTIGNPVISGFLYGKILDIAKTKVDLSYNVSVKELDVDVPIFKLVEVMGNLINNAMDALQESDQYNKLYIVLEEMGAEFVIEVRNESRFIDYNELNNYFVKGYSNKGENRGLGLYNVKKICEQHGLDLYCENKEIDGANWISFVVTNKKETI